MEVSDDRYQDAALASRPASPGSLHPGHADDG